MNGLAPLEIASHVLMGPDDSALAGDPSRETPLVALENSLRVALTKHPCVIAFSGGRDSSALLAVAAAVAQREGLPAPIPATLRFGNAPDAAEDQWQAFMIRHVGSPEWIRHDITDELDLVGPVARGLMDRHGLPYPYNLHLLVPLMEDARGGTLVTGLGGDQAFNPAGRALDVLARRIRPTPRDLPRVAIGLGPRAIRRAVRRRRDVRLAFPWLVPAANSAVGRQWLEDDVRRSFWWDAALREMWRSRFMQFTLHRIRALGLDLGVSVCHPFADWDVIDALARRFGRTGSHSRTTAMTALFGDTLPRELLNRPTKAAFNQVLWNGHAQAFAAQLGESGLEAALGRIGVGNIVDHRKLAAHWAAPRPLANSFLLLQACWLTSRRDP